MYLSIYLSIYIYIYIIKYTLWGPLSYKVFLQIAAGHWWQWQRTIRVRHLNLITKNHLQKLQHFDTFCYNMLQHFTKIRFKAKEVRGKSLNHNRCKAIRKQGETHFLKCQCDLRLIACPGPLALVSFWGVSDPKWATSRMRSPFYVCIEAYRSIFVETMSCCRRGVVGFSELSIRMALRPGY